jgi:hypothetical protein
MSISTAKIKKFISIRNKSGLHSNLQFMADLGRAGLTVDDLPDPVLIDIGHYEWNLGRYGTLVERNGWYSLE